MNGGCRVPYDARMVLRKLESGSADAEAWDELWQELHHQGDVGEASYAALPHLVRIAQGLPRRDWNFYGLVSLIELERHRKRNPPLPDWLVEDYRTGLQELLDLGLDDLRQEEDSL